MLTSNRAAALRSLMQWNKCRSSAILGPGTLAKFAQFSQLILLPIPSLERTYSGGAAVCSPGIGRLKIMNKADDGEALVRPMS
ncbi:hypothetical protein VTJ04DRAFT_9237 [Mycothermus thermophilus]|uniref:uncharacterized protein n=1 Tax=Humicola insolens TaxID=85995 RepID=UPI003744AB60